MATEEEIYRAVLEVEERGDLKAVAADAKAAEQLILELTAGFRDGRVGVADYGEGIAELGAELVGFRAKLDAAARADALAKAAERDAAAVQKAAQKAQQAADQFVAAEEAKAAAARDALGEIEATGARAGDAVTALGTKASRAGMGFRNLAYMIDDAKQFANGAAAGFNAIGNNLQGFLEGFKATAAIAPYVAIAGTAVAVLAAHWSELVRLVGFGQFQPAVDGLQKMEGELKKAQHEVEELGKLSNLTWAELQRYNDAKIKVTVLTEQVRDQKAVDEAVKAQTEAEQKIGAGFAKAVAEGGGPKARDDYRAALEGEKDARGRVYNFKTETNSGVDDAVRDNLAEALRGNARARDAIAASLPEGNRFRGAIADRSPKILSPEQKEAKDWADHQKDIDNARSLAQNERHNREVADEEKLDKEAEEHARREHQRGEDDLNKFNVEGRQKLDDEMQSAQLQDAMAKWREGRAEGQKTSQTFASGDAFKDAIQSAVKGPATDPTLVEQLTVQRNMEAYLKKISEQRTQREMARAG